MRFLSAQKKWYRADMEYNSQPSSTQKSKREACLEEGHLNISGPVQAPVSGEDRLLPSSFARQPQSSAPGCIEFDSEMLVLP